MKKNSEMLLNKVYFDVIKRLIAAPPDRYALERKPSWKIVWNIRCILIIDSMISVMNIVKIGVEYDMGNLLLDQMCSSVYGFTSISIH